jgi:hypothetical protein
MTLDGSLSQREEISWPKMGILKWPLTIHNVISDRIEAYSVIELTEIHVSFILAFIPGRAESQKQASELCPEEGGRS